MPIWDRWYTLNGMTITKIPFPQERLEIDKNMVLERSNGNPEECIAHLRVKTKEEEETLLVSESDKAAKERLLDFVSVYSLETYHTPKIQDGGASSISESDQLGNSNRRISATFSVIYSEEDKKKYMERESRGLTKAVDYFKSNEKIFRDESWLRNALRYFYFATTNERLEDKLINLITSLEALFFGKGYGGELRYRLSLRAAALIGNVFDDKKTEAVFDDIKTLYDKRCDVVHGRVTKVTYDDINKLKTYTKRSIKAFVLMLQTMSKEDILQLLDHCLIGKESADKLREITRERKMK